MTNVTVVIPVGPNEANKRWLGDCIKSVYNQTQRPDEVLIIADGCKVDHEIPPWINWSKWTNNFRVWETPWQSGVAHAFNFGIGLARNELVFMLGSDDYLAPDCLEQCVNVWEKNKRQDAYYWVGVEYLDEREDKKQFLPCNAAMVTKEFWKWCGGFPPETASGAPDAALISMLWNPKYSKKLVGVNSNKPLYYVRTHPGSDTSKRGPWQGVILQTRDILTASFKPNE